MKLMERVYSGITLICLLCIAALAAKMAGESGSLQTAAPVYQPPVQLQQQMPEPVPETDPTALHTGPVVLDENALTAQLAKLMPKELGMRDLQLSVRQNGQLRFSGTADRDGLLDWLEAKGAQLGGSMSPLRVLLPESIEFSVTLQAGRDTAGAVTLTPVAAALAGQDVTLPDLPEEVTGALHGAVNGTLAANGWDSGNLVFLDGGIQLG